MAERRACSFCGSDIEPGTGRIYIRKDGTIHYFCNSKCKKNMLHGRVGRGLKWTTYYSKTKKK